MLLQLLQKRQKHQFFQQFRVNARHFSKKLNISRDKSSTKEQVCPCFGRFNVLVHEVHRSFDKNRTKIVKIGKLSNLSFSMSSQETFPLENCIYFFSMHTGRHTFSLLTEFNVPIDDVYLENLELKSIKSLKNGKFWDFFVTFRVNLGHFHLKNCDKLFEKAYWTTNSFFVLCYPFQHSNRQNLLKVWEKLLEIFENRNFLGFLSFSVSI